MMDSKTPLRLVKAMDVSGLPVVTVDGGEDVAEIKDVVFDGASHRLIGFTLNKRGWFRGRLKSLLGAGDIQAIGPDAVMVSTEADLTEPDSAHPAMTGDEPLVTIDGTRVLAGDGTELGSVCGVVLSTGSPPAAVGYEVDTGDGAVFVPISAELAISDDNLLLPAAAKDFIVDDLTGFGAAVADFRAKLEQGASA